MSETSGLGYALDPRFLDHQNPSGHPECPERLESVMAMLGKFRRRDQLQQVSAEMVSLDLVTQVHSLELVQALRDSMTQPYTRFDADTYADSSSFEVARLATGHGVELTRRVLAGSLGAGLALIRPPGHHAESDRSMGFCLLNNVAVAAQAALQEGSVDRVAIVDFDVHHGNGTQQIFYSRSDVLYISAHQYPLYPGTGAFQESGQNQGLGFTVNFPLPAGLGNPTYNSLFSDLICPLVEAFGPQLILVSAGYDAHAQDPLASMNVSEKGFGQMTRQLNRAAERACQGKIVYFLEGGYNLAALAASVRATIRETLSPGNAPLDRDRSDFYRSYRDQAVKRLRTWWPSL